MGSFRTTKGMVEPSLPSPNLYFYLLIAEHSLPLPKVSGVLSSLTLPFTLTVSPREVTSRSPVTQSYCRQPHLFWLWLAVTPICPDAGDTGSDPKRRSVPHLVGRSRKKGKVVSLHLLSVAPCLAPCRMGAQSQNSVSHPVLSEKWAD